MNVLFGHQRMDQKAFLLQVLWSGQKGKVSSWWNFAWQYVQTHRLNFLAVFIWISGNYMPILTPYIAQATVSLDVDVFAEI